MDEYILPGSQILLENKFDELSIDSRLRNCLNEMNMIDLTPVQAACIPHLLEGKDLLGAAKTGSGKTLAFLVPLVNRVIKSGVARDTVAIIISPTRELSLQTFEVLQQLIAGTTITAGVVIGGNNRDEEARHLSRGVTIVVATPGRLLDHLHNTNQFNFNRLHTLVMDEADRLMSQGFLEEMTAILKKIPKERQTILFSATLNITSGKLKKKRQIILNDNNDVKQLKKNKMTVEDKVMKLACLSLKESCICIDMSMIDTLSVNLRSQCNTTTVAQLNSKFVICEAVDRFRLLYTLIQINQNKKVMIFMSTCLEVQFYYKLLRHIFGTDSNYSTVLALHGKQEQSKREKNFGKFKEENNIILLCTDVAARGLDIPQVDLVIQYDPPDDHKEFIHRVGRTARAGKSGEAIIILRPNERDFLSILFDAKIPVSALNFKMNNLAPIKESLEQIINSISELRTMAEEAYKSVISAYINNTVSCFDIDRLDLKALGSNFGLVAPPHFEIKFRQKKIKKSRKRNVHTKIEIVPTKVLKKK